MGNETGFGYQGPPRVYGSPQDSETANDLEDYVSRRIRARIAQPSGGNTSPSLNSHFDFTTITEDTAQLWVASSKQFVIPEGADGDYFLHVFMSVNNNSSGAATLSLVANGNTEDLIQIFSGGGEFVRFNTVVQMQEGATAYVAYTIPDNNLLYSQAIFTLTRLL